jgi:hypothetical protein
MGNYINLFLEEPIEKKLKIKSFLTNKNKTQLVTEIFSKPFEEHAKIYFPNFIGLLFPIKLHMPKCRVSYVFPYELYTKLKLESIETSWSLSQILKNYLYIEFFHEELYYDAVHQLFISR